MLNGDEKSISYIVSKVLPAPFTWAPPCIKGAYETSNVSPKTGTVTEKSTIVAEGLLPGTLSPNVLANDNTEVFSFA